MPINMKEFDNFFGDQLAFFVQISSKIVNFVCLSKMLNFAISFIFVQNEFFVSLYMQSAWIKLVQLAFGCTIISPLTYLLT